MERWSEEQAARYVAELFQQFEAIADGRVRGRPIPEAFGVKGWRSHYRRHIICWRETSDGTVAIMTVLLDAMEQGQQLSELHDRTPPPIG